MDFDGFTGRDAIHNAGSPFDSVFLFPFAAVGATGLTQRHGGLDFALVDGESSGHPFHQCTDKGAMARATECYPQSLAKTHLHGSTPERIAGPFRRCSLEFIFDFIGEERCFNDFSLGISGAVPRFDSFYGGGLLGRNDNDEGRSRT